MVRKSAGALRPLPPAAHLLEVSYASRFILVAAFECMSAADARFKTACSLVEAMQTLRVP